eukprot:5308243-Alexandrium_andersonii.AAC.1
MNGNSGKTKEANAVQNNASSLSTPVPAPQPQSASKQGNLQAAVYASPSASASSSWLMAMQCDTGVDAFDSALDPSMILVDSGAAATACPGHY